MDSQLVEAQSRDRRLDPNLGRMKPVFELAPVEHQLQRPDAEAQHREPEKVERVAPHRAGVAYEDEDAERAQCADRQIDIETPAPIEIFGQPAAEGRTDDRPHHRAGAEDRHRIAVALARVDRKERGLAERHEPCAEYALQDAVEHQLVEARRSAAQRRGDREPDHRGEKDVFDAKAAGEPAGQRHRDCRGDDVGRQYPGDLVLPCRHAALNVRQADVDDRRVEPLHDAGADHRRSDCGPVGRRRGAFSPHSSSPCGGRSVIIIGSKFSVIASAAKQSWANEPRKIASSLRSSQ